MSAIVGAHVSGVPSDVRGLEDLASELGVPLVFDAAHAAGSLVALDDGVRPLGGFGIAEVFNLTQAKVLSRAEGGPVTTNDAAFVEHIRLSAQLRTPGDCDVRFPGLIGRLS